jgi:hypothetical protein
MDNSTNYRGALLDAIYIDDTALLAGYLETVSAEAFKDDIKSLIELNDKRASESLKAFTMAAMQGLCANSIEFKHTPGEWELHAPIDHILRSDDGQSPSWEHHRFDIIGPGHKVIGEVKYSTAYRETKEGWPAVDDYNEYLANAHILKAAPLLLSALFGHDDNPGATSLGTSLRELSKFINPEEKHWIQWCKDQAAVIDAAISKATNTTQP